MHDLTCLPDQLRDDLTLVGGRYMRDCIRDLMDDSIGDSPLNYWFKIFPLARASTQIFRKLSHFPDKEGKTRTIAIFDYWSQTVLRPLHNHLNDVLKGI